MGEFYFCNVDTGTLYKLNKLHSKKLYKLYPNWRDLSSDDESGVLDKVKSYFVKNGKLVASDSNLTFRASY